jgi:hypothetical protein
MKMTNEEKDGKKQVGRLRRSERRWAGGSVESGELLCRWQCRFTLPRTPRVLRLRLAGAPPHQTGRKSGHVSCQPRHPHLAPTSHHPAHNPTSTSTPIVWSKSSTYHRSLAVHKRCPSALDPRLIRSSRPSPPLLSYPSPFISCPRHTNPRHTPFVWSYHPFFGYHIHPPQAPFRATCAHLNLVYLYHPIGRNL